jgi:hypothetical protein
MTRTSYIEFLGKRVILEWDATDMIGARILDDDEKLEESIKLETPDYHLSASLYGTAERNRWIGDWEEIKEKIVTVSNTNAESREVRVVVDQLPMSDEQADISERPADPEHKKEELLKQTRRELMELCIAGDIDFNSKDTKPELADKLLASGLY